MRHVTDTLLYGDNMNRLDKKKPLLWPYNVMPCLKPTKSGCVILRNDVQRELRHTPAVCTNNWKRQILYIFLDEVTFTLGLSLLDVT